MWNIGRLSTIVRIIIVTVISTHLMVHTLVIMVTNNIHLVFIHVHVYQSNNNYSSKYMEIHCVLELQHGLTNPSSNLHLQLYVYVVIYYIWNDILFNVWF